MLIRYANICSNVNDHRQKVSVFDSSMDSGIKGSLSCKETSKEKRF